MATPFLGRGSAIGWGEESTWGTPVSRAVWSPVISMSGMRKATKVSRPHLVGDSGALVRRTHFISEDRTSGQFEMELRYSGIGTWLKHALGKVTTSGSGPYVHTLELGALPIPAKPGLTLEYIRGDATNSEVFEGVLVNRMEIRSGRGEVARLIINWMAETAPARAAAGSVTLPSNDDPVLHSHFGQFGFNSNNYDMIDWSFVLDNKLTDRQFLGSALTSQPVVSDFRSGELRVTLEYTDDNPYAELLADTQGDATLTATGSGNLMMPFTFQNAYITDVTTPISSAGVITQTVTFAIESDGTDEGFKIALVNDDSDVDAAA